MFSFSFDDAGRRGQSKKLLKSTILDTTKYAFGNRIVYKWNALPKSCVDCTTLNEFKPKINLAELELDAKKLCVL